jgi:hypothetical protein
MKANRPVTVTFTADPKYKLTVVKTGAGTGTITSDPAGINCPGDCKELIWKNDKVTLTAAAGTGSIFTGWSGAYTGTDQTCTIKVKAAKTLTANFIPYPTLTVKKAGTGSGTATSDDANINCGADCSETYTEVKTVILTATPDVNSIFTGWTGCKPLTGEPSKCSMTMNAIKTVTANFAPTLVGSWDMSFNMTVSVTFPEYGTYSETVKVPDHFTFHEDGTFEMIDMQGKWTQKGNAFTIKIPRADLESYFEAAIREQLGTDVNVTVTQITFTGTHRWATDRINGTMILVMNIYLPAYGLSGTASVNATFTGVRADGLQGLTMSKENENRSQSMIKIIEEKLMKAIMP